MDFDVDGLSDRELAELSKAVAERLQRRKVLAAGAGAAVGGSFLAGQETARADPQTTQSGTYGDGDEDWNAQDIDANHVASNSVTTDDVSVTKFGKFASHTAIETGGTQYVIDRTGKVVYDSDSDGDIGAIINQLQDDNPEGFHLHLSDNLDYSTDILVDKPCAITGGAPLMQESIPRVTTTPTAGLNYLGSGDPFTIRAATAADLGNIYLDGFVLDANSGTRGVYIDGETNGSLSNIVVPSLAVRGGNGNGFTVHDDVFGSHFGYILVRDSGGDGFVMDEGAGRRPGQNTVVHVRALNTTGHPVNISSTQTLNAGLFYGLNAGTGKDSITLGTVFDSSIGVVHGEGGDSAGVRLGAVGRSEIGHVKALTSAGDGVVVGDPGNFFSSKIGTIRESGSATTGVDLLSVRSGSRIGTINCTTSLNYGDIRNSWVDAVENGGTGPTSWESHYGQSDGDSDGQITVQFHGEYSGRPGVAFGRQGGGVDSWFYNSNAGGRIDSVDVNIGTSGATIDLHVVD
jgi:hypothetical protein